MSASAFCSILQYIESRQHIIILPSNFFRASHARRVIVCVCVSFFYPVCFVSFASLPGSFSIIFDLFFVRLVIIANGPSVAPAHNLVRTHFEDIFPA